ncbi:MAG: DNA replication/repair protein RecF [Acidimicrobiia bacterium]
MRLDWIQLHRFRCYSELRFVPDPGVNLLIGENGAGKTSLLEGIGYLSSLSSFRNVPDAELVAEGEEVAAVRGSIGREESPSLVEVEIRRRGGRRALLDRTRLQRSSDLLGVVRVVTFLPDDLDLVKRGPGYRRDLLDSTAVQLWPGSHADQAEFERALRQRNAFLRAGVPDETTLAVWDERLALAGGRVMARRAQCARALSERLGGAYRAVAGSGPDVALVYRSEWGADLDPSVGATEWAAMLVERLRGRRREDFERRQTSTGPQRDEPVFLLDGHDIRFRGSQGEQRTLALAVRLATHTAVEEVVGVTPLLVLDDVFSELDEKRSRALADALPTAQTFISSARPEDVPVRGRVWSVTRGAVR